MHIHQESHRRAAASTAYLTSILIVMAFVCTLWISLARAEHTVQVKKTQTARVVKVLDGDTIIVTIGSKQEHVRLIGIDTPETRPNRRADTQARERQLDQVAIFRMGHLAANHSRMLLPKKSTVQLEYDVAMRDHYQRLLAYVWLPSGSMANEEIVKAGYAYLLTVPPNVKYRDRFVVAFSEARKAQRGLWAKR